MRVVVSALLLSSALLCAPATADPSHSSEEIVEFFANSSAQLGAARGICVGTEEECAAKQAAAAAPPGLDMLINFELDSAELTPQARETLGEFAQALKDSRLESHDFLVEGHTDAFGSADYNVGLSERRADSVVSFLLANGVDAARIEAVGFGKAHPRVADPYDPVNRRVEMRIDVQ